MARVMAYRLVVMMYFQAHRQVADGMPHRQQLRRQIWTTISRSKHIKLNYQGILCKKYAFFACVKHQF